MSANRTMRTRAMTHTTSSWELDEKLNESKAAHSKWNPMANQMKLELQQFPGFSCHDLFAGKWKAFARWDNPTLRRSLQCRVSQRWAISRPPCGVALRNLALNASDRRPARQMSSSQLPAELHWPRRYTAALLSRRAQLQQQPEQDLKARLNP